MRLRNTLKAQYRRTIEHYESILLSRSVKIELFSQILTKIE